MTAVAMHPRPGPEHDSAGELWRPTPLSALERPVIPTELHYVRDHFPAPVVHRAAWSMELRGARRSVALDLAALVELGRRELSVVLECAGHRRVEFDPVPDGVPWALGAIAEARWAGVPLRTVLERAGIPTGAHEVVLEGADAGAVAGFTGTHRYARSLPLAKALDEDVLLAYEMNGAPIPDRRGGPVRAIVPGWYATDSVKWLARIWYVQGEFDGVFQAHDYRLRATGEPEPGRRMTELPVHAVITSPATGGVVRAGSAAVAIRGIGWGGQGGVARVLVSVDGAEWVDARLLPGVEPYGRVYWELRAPLSAGVHELACRAIDSAGETQPDQPPPNVRGYGNNAVHRVRLSVTEARRSPPPRGPRRRSQPGGS